MECITKTTNKPNMRAIIPVAGFGTRLRPHTYTLPKVLLNVAGKPILGHILDTLQQQGINDATIIVGYMAELVQEYVTKNYSMNVEFVTQEKPMGLGHSIWCARNTIDNDPIFIILGDTIFDVDLSLALGSNFSTIGVKTVEDPRRFGVVEMSKGFITHMIEKPEEPTSHLAIVGLYYIANSPLLKECLNEMMEKDIRTRNEYQLTDALQMMIDKGEKFTTFPVDGWYDCGKPETMLETNRYLLNKYPTSSQVNGSVIVPPVFIAPNATIENSVVGPYTTVAAGATVKDSIVRNCIISDGASVSGSLLEDSIIGNNASVAGKFKRLNVGDSSEIHYGM